MPRQQFAYTRLFHPHLMQSSRTFSVTFPTSSLSTPATYGGWKPAPTSRLRRTSLHLRYSIVPQHVLDTTPHRSVRARLRIRLLPRMNGVEAFIGVRMQNTRLWNPPVEQWVETVPSEFGRFASETESGGHT